MLESDTEIPQDSQGEYGRGKVEGEGGIVEAGKYPKVFVYLQVFMYCFCDDEPIICLGKATCP